jgi:hypothetical protein
MAIFEINITSFFLIENEHTLLYKKISASDNRNAYFSLCFFIEGFNKCQNTF